MENLKHKIVKARKQHRCSLCGYIIKVGEKYEDNFMVDGGDNWVWKECMSCKKITHILANKGYLDLSEYDGDDFADAVEEYLHDLPLEKQSEAIIYLEKEGE